MEIIAALLLVLVAGAWAGYLQYRARTVGECQARCEAATNQVAVLIRALEGAHERHRDLVQAHTELTRQVIELKRLGFEPAAPTGPPPELGQADVLPQEIEDAVQEMAPYGSALWYQLRRYAGRRLRGNAKPEEVEQEILSGAELDL